MRVREFTTPMRGEDMPYPGCINVALAEEDGEIAILLYDNETMVLQGCCGVNAEGSPEAFGALHGRLVVDERVVLPANTEYIRQVTEE